MISLVRKIFVLAARLFPREHGKYSILTRLYFPLFGATAPTKKIEKVKFGIKLNLNLQEYLQSWIYVFGAYELPTVRFMRSYLKDGDVAIDVGGQIGYLSIIMATSANRHVQVVSFEPEPGNINSFKQNIELNTLENVTLVEKAVSDHAGKIKLYLSSDRNAGTHSTVFVEGNVSEEFVEIDAVTIDDEVSSRGIDRVDLIKIDVEGGEIDVIRGSVKTLMSFQPVVITELGDALQKARGFSTDEFKLFMEDHGYNCYTILNDGTLRSTAVGDFHLMDNVVFVPTTRLSRVSIAS